MPTPHRTMPISAWWYQGAIVTFMIGFAILGCLAYLTYAEQPPIPERFVSTSGETLFTHGDIIGGMNVFQRYGVMEYGTLYGHGAYLGPDFTADYVHRAAGYLIARYEKDPQAGVSARDRVAAELHENTYDPAAGTVTFTPARAGAHRMLVAHYAAMFQNKKSEGGRQAQWITNPEDVRKLTAFFGWAAWTTTANRPGTTSSYTNNWPPEPLAGNHLTADAITWSVISIIGLFAGTGIILFFFGRHDWLGWGKEGRAISLRPVEEFASTPGQRVILWFLVVSTLLFLLQTLLGGLIAHYRAQPADFFGVDVSSVLPYNVARSWHLQLAIFWVSASYLATALFIAPLISAREPRGQAPLTAALLGAVTLVVIGSLAGIYTSIQGWLKGAASWFWIGNQGWEYIDLGRLWQILLIIGLLLWVFILWRGLRGTLAQYHRARMPWLLFYSAFSIPAFYAVGLLASPTKGFVITDFWRFWVVHLWVEDFLELFTTVMVAYMFVLLGMVATETALRVIYLDIILYSVGGVVGTMHHLYFSGTPVAHMAFGATFSALEVVPLLLLTLEAWGFMRAGERAMPGVRHPHRWAVWFLVAVGVWNFAGAGIFGFLINLPAVSYYEIGTNLTANHGHTAMMGVYGMLAIGLLLFCLRYLMRPDKWSDRLLKVSFWSLNIGLAWMAFANLFPVGIIQLYHAVGTGYWHARSLDFLMTPWVNKLEWARLPGDALIIAGGAAPLAWLCLRAVRHQNPRRRPAGEAEPVRLFVEQG